jgi:hypothetical protein
MGFEIDRNLRHLWRLQMLYQTLQIGNILDELKRRVLYIFGCVNFKIERDCDVAVNCLNFVLIWVRQRAEVFLSFVVTVEQ